MTQMCACGQRPVDKPGRPVENPQNPARKILDAMSLNLKTSSNKSRSDSQPTGARDATNGLRTAVHNQDQILAAILEAIDLVNARIDAIESRIR